ncbi:MAG: type 2 isopentenyl-diphosphate Delta-isomerase [Methanomicrobiales archaeon]|nr:type 2 isopentenyl-diphosphate Delta-isomerase [Methanomicrobiales archaeon]
MAKDNSTSPRKLDHIRICLEEQVEAGNPGFADVHLVHCALPGTDLDRIDTSVRFLGYRLRSPLFIAAMTGGHPSTTGINRRLAAAAEHFGIGMGVGSQRAALENPDLEGSFTVVREEAPTAFLCANLGAVQLRDHGIEWADRAVEMIGAQALCVHLNFLQEAIQPEGDHDATGCLEAIRDLCSDFRVPVIAKETGAGISRETSDLLWGAGVAAIDVGGAGGTSWALVESLRARDEAAAGRGRRFAAWGIPTVASLCEVAGTGGPVIATGGIRSGMDMAKAVALGADLCGMALPLLAPAVEGEEQLCSAITGLQEDLQTAMFLTGSRSVAELHRARTWITGSTRQMTKNKKKGD